MDEIKREFRVVERNTTTKEWIPTTEWSSNYNLVYTLYQVALKSGMAIVGIENRKAGIYNV